MNIHPDPKNLPLTVSRPELLMDGSDAQFRQLVHRLLAYASSLEAIRAGLGEMIGLSGVQYTILICIAHLEEGRGVGVKAIADHLSYTGAFVTIETGKLAALGLVEKRQNPRRQAPGAPDRHGARPGTLARVGPGAASGQRHFVCVSRRQGVSKRCAGNRKS